MLKIDLRELDQGPVETPAELAVGDPVFEGLDVALGAPVRVRGRLQATGEGRFYWHGNLQTMVVGECRRCLVPVTTEVAAEIGALFSQDQDARDDPEAYPMARDATHIDLAPAVREELVLSVPKFLLCREDCRGLCPRCGKDLNAGPCDCPPATDSRWRGLEALKGKLRD